MACKRFEKGSDEWRLFQEFWGLCQKYWIPEDNDEYWESFIDAGNDFLKKNNGEEKGAFANKLFWSFHEILEQKYKEMKNK